MEQIAVKLAPVVIEEATRFISKKATPASSELSSAAAVNDRATVRSILSQNPTANRTPALVAASSAGLLDVIDILLNSSPPHRGQSSSTSEEFRGRCLNAWASGSTPLLAAVKENHGKTTKLLLEEGADPDMWTKNAGPALQVAAKGGFLYVMKILIQFGADVNFRDSVGDTALIVASRYSHSHTARYLLDHGARIDARNSKGATALLVAARHDSVEVLSVLLQHGADVNARDKKGKGVLHRAVEGSWFGTQTPPSVKEDIISTLLDAGADPKVKDAEGKTAAQRVKWQKGGERLRRLLDPHHHSHKQKLLEEEINAQPYKRTNTF